MSRLGDIFGILADAHSEIGEALSEEPNAETREHLYDARRLVADALTEMQGAQDASEAT